MKQLLTFVFAVTLICHTALAEYRTFTSTEGQKITAKITGIDDQGNVSLKLKNGTPYKNVSPKKFSKEDQKYFVQWKKDFESNILPSDIEIGFHTSKGKVERSKVPVTTIQGNRYKDGMTVKEWPAFYVVKLRNVSQKPLKGLKMEYVIFKEADNMTYNTNKRSDIKMIRQKGALDVPTLEIFREQELQTQGLPMREVKYNHGIEAVGSGDTKSKDDLAGIWLRIYKDKQLIVEKIYPESIARSEKW